MKRLDLLSAFALATCLSLCVPTSGASLTSACRSLTQPGSSSAWTCVKTGTLVSPWTNVPYRIGSNGHPECASQDGKSCWTTRSPNCSAKVLQKPTKVVNCHQAKYPDWCRHTRAYFAALVCSCNNGSVVTASSSKVVFRSFCDKMSGCYDFGCDAGCLATLTAAPGYKMDVIDVFKSGQLSYVAAGVSIISGYREGVLTEIEVFAASAVGVITPIVRQPPAVDLQDRWGNIAGLQFAQIIDENNMPFDGCFNDCGKVPSFAVCARPTPSVKRGRYTCLSGVLDGLGNITRSLVTGREVLCAKACKLAGPQRCTSFRHYSNNVCEFLVNLFTYPPAGRYAGAGRGANATCTEAVDTWKPPGKLQGWGCYQWSSSDIAKRTQLVGAGLRYSAAEQFVCVARRVWSAGNNTKFPGCGSCHCCATLDGVRWWCHTWSSSELRRSAALQLSGLTKAKAEAQVCQAGRRWTGGNATAAPGCGSCFCCLNTGPSGPTCVSDIVIEDPEAAVFKNVPSAQACAAALSRLAQASDYGIYPQHDEYNDYWASWSYLPSRECRIYFGWSSVYAGVRVDSKPAPRVRYVKGATTCTAPDGTGDFVPLAHFAGPSVNYQYIA